ncbi:MAG: pilus assembly protein [Belnapia sp.]|nr:pilus assembly protein [Belnapia sp.]
MTWSILARDAATGELGVAVATRFFAVGAVCPRVEGGVGAVATQALVNPMLGILGLDRLRAGEPPDVALAALIAGDAGRDHRQLHMLSATGAVAHHTGAACIDWCGHAGGPDVSVAGNMLAGPEVVAATRDAWLARAGRPMAERLLAALEAGEAAGGDMRGKQSAALQVASRDPYPDLDIRVDDHPDPLAELRRLHLVAQQHYVGFRRFLAGRDHPGVFDRAVIEAASSQDTG